MSASLAVDPYGRVLTALDHFTATDRALVARMPVNAYVFTLFTVIGDAFGWATVVRFLVTLVWAVMRERRRREVGVIPAERTATT
ncbi:MAG: hypothetical protein R3C14_37485 [Caldilineaceae bacterium]